MICSNCGNEIDDGVKTCPICGKAFESPDDGAVKTVVKKQNLFSGFTAVGYISFATLMISLAALFIGILVLIIKSREGTGDLFFAYLMMMVIFNGSSIFLSYDTFKMERRLAKINRESKIGKKKVQPVSSVVIAGSVCILALIFTVIFAIAF